MQYNIEGGSLPVVICNLEVGETLITEGGAMSWMSSNIVMETVGQSVGKALGRLVSGESLFLNKYTA
ncbi:MAG TPA: AIM24 family protein, partial [Saccharofermentans sp.]|nr:AIM24 family protein [Saccharofermentans sp.]